MNNLLDDLFYKYHADKTPRIKHHYSEVYYHLFKGKRDIVEEVLEIGTAEGASLFAWRDFFPKATIYGGEIDQHRVELMKGQDRIKVFQCDQSKPEDLNKLAVESQISRFADLIVDDGSHRPSDQLLTAMFFLGTMQGGTYVIEDVDDASTPYLMSFLEEYNPREYHVGSRHDDRLLVFQR